MLQLFHAWTENAHLQATTQIGFRKTQGTGKGTFFLKHVIDSSRIVKKSVYAAFVVYGRLMAALIERFSGQYSSP
jgi:hypothetical protein